MALSKGIWDPKLRGTNIKGTNLKSLSRRWVWGARLLHFDGIRFDKISMKLYRQPCRHILQAPPGFKGYFWFLAG